MKVSPARRAAYDVLHDVGAEGAYANLALAQALAGRDLSTADKGLATDIVYTTLRRRATIDAVLATVMTRSLADTDPRVVDVLRMAVAEHMYLGKPAHAVVDSAVDLVQSVGAGSARGFVNAILRKVTSRSAERLVASATDGLSGDDELSVRFSHPRWIIRALRDVVGPAELPELLETDNQPPRVTLAARPARIDRADLPGDPTPWSPWGVFVERTDPGTIAAVRDGRAGVQDLGSQLVVLALTRAHVDGPDDSWLDMCAGPGGKSALLADLLAPDGRLVAVEQHAHRADLVESALRGTPNHAEVVIADAAEINGTYSRVLVDAPCSGLGVLRRRPDSRWRRQPSDIPALTGSQTTLLNHAIDVCRPGGVVGYVTCSPHLAETDLIVEDVLRRRDDVVQEDAAALLPEVPDCADGLTVRLWPHRHGTDGMYMALLRKKR
ncbi:MAG: transcription antitermination factor NusB [Candidatus Nanopelagicales bacterium]